MKKQQTLKMVVLAIFVALTIVFQAFATLFKVGQYSLPLSLVVIAVGALLYGPLAGAFLGFVWGTYILIFDPSCSFFLNANPPLSIFYTFVATSIRGTLGGLLTGLIYKGLKSVFKFKGGDYLAMVIASLLLPLINKVYS
jgi:uncharacterized membrane protein